jgi:translation initiation factor 3 subunit J
MVHARGLFGAVGIDDGSGTSGRQATQTKIADPKDPSKTIDLSSLDIFNPTTMADFNKLREVLAPLLAANVKKGHYNTFLQEFTRAITKDLPSEQIKTLASKLTALSNEKQKEEKAAEKGSKKKATKKANLVAAGKEMDRIDTRNYEGEYDDL